MIDVIQVTASDGHLELACDVLGDPRTVYPFSVLIIASINRSVDTCIHEPDSELTNTDRAHTISLLHAALIKRTLIASE